MERYTGEFACLMRYRLLARRARPRPPVLSPRRDIKYSASPTSAPHPGGGGGGGRAFIALDDRAPATGKSWSPDNDSRVAPRPKAADAIIVTPPTEFLQLEYRSIVEAHLIPSVLII